MRNALLKISIIAVMLIAVSLISTDRIVSPSGPYFTIFEAYNVADNGDRILLQANRTFYGTGTLDFIIEKNLTFDRTGIGADPIINLESNGRLFTINPGFTVSINNLNI